LGSFGTTDASTETTSSGPFTMAGCRRELSALLFSGELARLPDSVKVKGRVVNRAASSRRKMS
jgi:hypothetical protein